MTSLPSSGTRWTNQITIAPARSAGASFFFGLPRCRCVGGGEKLVPVAGAAGSFTFCLRRLTGEAARGVARLQSFWVQVVTQNGGHVTMALLVLGLIVFLGAHSIRIFANGWRRRQVARFGGEGLWKGN